MNLAGLSLDNIPPLRTPLHFFLWAPLFGVLAGLLLIGEPQLLSGRWHPATLAFTHLLTLGFGAMVMLGALFQVLPVVSNRAVPGSRTLAPWVRRGLAAGVLCLAGGFLTGAAPLFAAALGLLGAALVLFLGALGLGLTRARPAGDSTFTLRLAALALGGVVTLGAMQLGARIWPDAGLYHPALTGLHALWGGFGWALLLIMGVSFQVIPMFHVAPAFPGWVCRRLTLALFLLDTVVLLAPGGGVATTALALVLLAALGYVACALRVLARRKRKLVDYTVRCWQLGLSQLLATALLGLGLLALDPAGRPASLELLLGLGFGVGFVLTVILGMLQKIVPFLIYLHLQRLVMANPQAMALPLPHMKALIPTERSRWQYRLQLFTLPCLYLALWLPALAPLAGAALVANFAWLGFCLLGAWRQYRRFEREAGQLTAPTGG